MDTQEIEIREPGTDQERRENIRFRWLYLRKPLGMRLNSATDEFEHQAYQLIAYLKNALGEQTMVGTGRLHINSGREAQIRYLAVAEANRQQGIGRRLVRALETRARQLQHQQVVVDVREGALAFYRAMGYQIVAGPFEKLDGIKHYKMKNHVAAL